MYVTSHAREQGIGKLVLSELMVRAKAIDGIEQIYLTVVSTNTPAKSLYEGYGFKTFGTEERALKVGNRYLDEEHRVLYFDR